MQNFKSEKKSLRASIKENFIWVDFLYPLVFMLVAIIFEMVSFLWLGLGVLPEYFILDFSIIIMITGLLVFVPSRLWQLILTFFFLSIGCTINIVNACLYQTFGDIFYYNLMVLAMEAATAFDLSYIDWFSVLVNLGILAISITFMVIMYKKHKHVKHQKFSYKFSLILVVFIALESCGIGMFNGSKLAFNNAEKNSEFYIIEDDSYQYDHTIFKIDCLKKFGTWGFYTKELLNYISAQNENISEERKAELVQFLDEGRVAANTDAPLANDNLIIIMLESLQWFGIDPIYTPTLYSIFYGDANANGVYEAEALNSIPLTNYYSKHKTNISEGGVLLGNMPNEITLGKCLLDNGLDLPNALPNLFKANGGAITNYVHGYFGDFYDRRSIYPNMGYDKITALEDLKLSYGTKYDAFGNLPSDIDVVGAGMKYIIPSKTERFMTSYLTIKTHGPYQTTSPLLEEEYNLLNDEDKFAKFLEWNNANTSFIIPEKDAANFKYFINYKASCMDTDKAVKAIIDKLKNDGILDKTGLLLYGDHNAYANDLCFDIMGLDRKDSFDSAPYHVPCAFVSNKLEDKKISDFVSMYDLYPTICELYGLPYNKALSQGQNILSPDFKNSVTVSYICGIFTDKLFSRNISEIYTCTAEPVTEQERYNFQTNAIKFWLKQAYIDDIYRSNILSEYQW